MRFDVNGCHRLYGTTMAHEAVRSGDVELLQHIFASAGDTVVDVNKEDLIKGWSVLLFACTRKRLQMLRALMAYAKEHNLPIDMSKRDKSGTAYAIRVVQTQSNSIIAEVFANTNVLNKVSNNSN